MEEWVFLFDFDGVLVDTEFYYTEFWRKQGLKYFPEIADFEHVIKGRSLKTIYAEYFADKPEARNAVTEELRVQEQGMVYEYIDGAEDFVEACGRCGKTALVTSSSQSKMENVYRALPHLKACFGSIVTAEDVNESKPSPECYLKAAERLGVNARDCIVFEDSLAGIRAGKAAGMRVIALETTLSREELAGKADMIIPNFVGITPESIIEML